MSQNHNIPESCRKCGVKGTQNFYVDTIQTVTYRCRLCGTEHYPGGILNASLRNIEVQGYRVHKA